MALTSTTSFTAINAQVTMKKVFVVAVLFCLLAQFTTAHPLAAISAEAENQGIGEESANLKQPERIDEEAANLRKKNGPKIGEEAANLKKAKKNKKPSRQGKKGTKKIGEEAANLKKAKKNKKPSRQIRIDEESANLKKKKKNKKPSRQGNKIGEEAANLDAGSHHE